jgi:hypothetical protein
VFAQIVNAQIIAHGPSGDCSVLVWEERVTGFAFMAHPAEITKAEPRQPLEGSLDAGVLSGVTPESKKICNEHNQEKRSLRYRSPAASDSG